MKVVCSRGRGIFEHGKQGSIRAFKFLLDLPPSLRANAADGSLFGAASSAIEDVFIRLVAKMADGREKAETATVSYVFHEYAKKSELGVKSLVQV